MRRRGNNVGNVIVIRVWICIGEKMKHVTYALIVGKDGQRSNQIEIWCEVCGCKVRKCKWVRHEKTKKHMMGGGGGNLDGGGGVG